MKSLLLILFSSYLAAQTNPAIVINNTRVQRGISGDYLKVNPNGTLGQGTAGTGTLTSVATACGATGGTITTTGTISTQELINSQAGAYAILTGDCGKAVVSSDASAAAYTIAAAGSSGFPSGWYVDLRAGGTGTVTLTPATSTINGATTLVLTTGQSARIISDGTNYTALLGGGDGFIYTGVLSGLPATCTVGQVAFVTDATPGQNQYNCTATNVWTQNLNSGAGGASTALDNLASVDINTSLLAQTGVDLGSTTKPVRNIFLWGTGTYSSTYIEFTGAPTGNRVWAFPDTSDTVIGLAATQTLTNKTVDGVTPTIFGYVDPTSSIQTQLNSKLTNGADTSCSTGTASCVIFQPGTAPTGESATGIQNIAPTSATPYRDVRPGTVGTSGFERVDVSGVVATHSYGPIVSGDLPAQYKTLSCQPGLGDGFNAIAAHTYLQTNCWNKTGVTITITAIQCFSDNAGSSTMDVTNGAATDLLTGPITCSSTIASGTQSATTTIVNNDFLQFTFVADGTSKQTTWVISETY